MIRDFLVSGFFFVSALVLAVTLFLAAAAPANFKADPVTPAVRDPQPVRADRSFLVLAAPAPSLW